MRAYSNMIPLMAGVQNCYHNDLAERRATQAGDHELVVIKQRCTAFAFGPSLLAVTQHLVDGLGHGLFDFGRFALDHHNRQAI